MLYPNRLSPPKKKISPERIYSPSKYQPNNEKLHGKNYFCHYSNAVYMGGIDCFKKHGRGIILMDNGTCILTNHSHDNMIYHNIFFRDHSLTSVFINVDRTKSVCFRSGPYLNYFKLTSKDIIDGVGYFIHYRHRKIFRIKYQKGNVTVKQRIVDIAIVQTLFNQNNLQAIMQKEHSNAIKALFDLPNQMLLQQSNDRYLIGFTQNNKNKYLGLYFKVIIKKYDSDYDVILQQRGYVQKQLMQLFGQRHFDNGNYYIGDFKNGQFHGRGVLIYPKQKKWTYGEYFNGELKDVLQTSIHAENINCNSIIKKIHQYSKPYIQSRIQIQQQQRFLYTLSEAIDQKDPFEHESIDYSKEQNKIISNLNLIQSDYTKGKYQSRTQVALKDLMDLKNKDKLENKKNRSKNNSPQKVQNKIVSKQKNKTTHKIKYLSNYRNRTNTRQQAGYQQRQRTKSKQSIQKTRSNQKQFNEPSKTNSPKRQTFDDSSPNLIKNQPQKYQQRVYESIQPSPIGRLNTFTNQEQNKLSQTLYHDLKDRKTPPKYFQRTRGADILIRQDKSGQIYKPSSYTYGYLPYYDDYYSRSGQRLSKSPNRILSPQKSIYSRRPYYRYLQQQNTLDYQTYKRMSNYPYIRKQFPY